MVREEFWRGRRVLVTGHTGFKGAWLSLWLHQMGAIVHGYALKPTTTPSFFEVTGLHDKFHSTYGDICDFKALRKFILQTRPEVVFHLAAQALVGPSYTDPVGTFETNVSGTVKVLEAVRQCKDTRVAVVVTSDKCYAIVEGGKSFVETDRLGGLDPYSSSKACAELVTESYSRSLMHGPDGARVATARAGNVIGGGDWAPDRLIPDIVRATSSGEPLSIRNPDSTRPWQHVLDALAGYISLAQALHADASFKGPWNFSGDDSSAWNVRRLAKEFLEYLGTECQLVCDGHKRFEETEVLRLDSSKARRDLEWGPYLSVPQAIEWTADWYRRFSSGKNMFDGSVGDIEKYMGADRGPL